MPTSRTGVNLNESGNVLAIYKQNNITIYTEVDDVWNSYSESVNSGETNRTNFPRMVQLNASGDIMIFGHNLSYQTTSFHDVKIMFKDSTTTWSTPIKYDSVKSIGGGISINDNSSDINDDTSNPSVHIYQKTGDLYSSDTSWSNLIRDISIENSKNTAISLNASGDMIAIGMPCANNNYGVTKTYKRSSNSWNLLYTISGEKDKHGLGGSVSLNNEGNIIALGGYMHDDTITDFSQGHVEIWKYIESNNELTQLGVDIDCVDTATAQIQVELNSLGDRIIIGNNKYVEENWNGHVFVYEYG